VSWGELDQRVDAVAALLHSRGVGRGEHVALVAANGAPFAAAFWGILRAGAVAVPVNPAYTPREVGYILADAGVTLALAEAAAAVTVARAASFAGRDVTVLAPDTAARGTVSARGGGQDTAVICYTSGTTGRPKGALLTHENFLANLDGFSDLPRLALSSGDVLLGVLPFFHIFGLNVILNAAARAGASVLAVERFTPAGSLAALAEHGVTVAYGAPPVFAAWNAVAPHETPALPRLRAAVSGADALPVATWTAFRDRYGLEILEGYGLTETAPVLASNAVAPAVVPGSVGHPLPNVGLRVVDTGWQDVATGETGEILARGPNVFAGYHGRPDATAEACRGGWFATGDLGRVDGDGYLSVVGRLKDMVIVSGFNVYPREVEDVLVTHAGVAEAAVVGVPDSRTGERVRAVVVPRRGVELDVDEVLGYCREQLARYKLPREVHVVDALPRLPSGKVVKSRLRAL
jgi:long-chain acyl-CoA synthetase